MNTDDWPTTREDFATIFAGYHTRQRTHLRDVNIVTSEFLGNVIAPGGEIVEISTGWLLGHRLIGVTYPRRDNDMPDERDGCFDTLQQAYDHIYREET